MCLIYFLLESLKFKVHVLLLILSISFYVTSLLMCKIVNNNYFNLLQLFFCFVAGDRYKPSDCDGFSLIDEVTADLSKTEPCLELKHHDINIQIDEDYWRVGPSEVLACCLAAGLQKYSISHPVRYGIISPVCFLSFKTERAVQVHFNVPHALKTLNEDYLK